MTIYNNLRIIKDMIEEERRDKSELRNVCLHVSNLTVSE